MTIPFAPKGPKQPPPPPPEPFNPLVEAERLFKDLEKRKMAKPDDEELYLNCTDLQIQALGVVMQVV